MTKDENSLSGRVSVGRRSVVKGMTITGAALGMPRWTFADDDANYTNASVDWRQFSGQTITLAGAAHPWSSTITPLLTQFTKLTGIRVVTDFERETKFVSTLPLKLNRGSTTPDVFMFLAYGQGISAAWLEPLSAYFFDKSLSDLAWYDEGDLLEFARSFSLWSDGERYAFPIISEATTLFMNGDALAAKNLPVPRTFDELLATAKAVKTSKMSGIAMQAKASGNSALAASSFVFSYGGDLIKDNKATFDSPEAVAAIEMYGQLLSQAGPFGVGTYDWYKVLNDVLQGRTAMAIDSSNFATDISNPAESLMARQATFAAIPHLPDRPPSLMMLPWQACINAKSRNKKAAFLFLLWATSKPTSLKAAAAGLATTRASAWSSEGFKKAFGAQAAAAAITNLQYVDVGRAKAILFHQRSSDILDAFMIGVNEAVSGRKSSQDAMTAAARMANAEIRG
jgi:multiple sugar transport system substrate-binding protein